MKINSARKFLVAVAIGGVFCITYWSLPIGDKGVVVIEPAPSSSDLIEPEAIANVLLEVNEKSIRCLPETIANNDVDMQLLVAPRQSIDVQMTMTFLQPIRHGIVPPDMPALPFGCDSGKPVEVRCHVFKKPLFGELVPVRTQNSGPGSIDITPDCSTLEYSSHTAAPRELGDYVFHVAFFNDHPPLDRATSEELARTNVFHFEPKLIWEFPLTVR